VEASKKSKKKKKKNKKQKQLNELEESKDGGQGMYLNPQDNPRYSSCNDQDDPVSQTMPGSTK